MEEVEVKFLDIDPQSLEEKLLHLGAKKEFDRLYKRKVFDYPDLRLNAQGAWVRLRDEGDKVTLTYKQRLGIGTTSAGDAGMEEIEIVVDSFEKTAQILKKIGLKEKFYEENKRVRYRLNNITFDIDTWPMLKPYLEIEAITWQEIDEAISLLGLDSAKKKICSTYQIYQEQGIDELSYSEITFSSQVKKSEY